MHPDFPVPPGTTSNVTTSSQNQTGQTIINLSGIWSANDGGTYFIRQLGNVLWWLGLSENNGDSFTNVFKGIINDNKIDGEWTDVPKGATRNHGTLTLNITNNFATGTKLQKTSQTGGFAGSLWTLREAESMSSTGETISELSQNTQSPGQSGAQENKSTTTVDMATND